GLISSCLPTFGTGHRTRGPRAYRPRPTRRPAAADRPGETAQLSLAARLPRRRGPRLERPLRGAAGISLLPPFSVSRVGQDNQDRDGILSNSYSSSFGPDSRSGLPN